MIQNLQMYKEEPLMRIAYEICRWHHERYDGSGYPDGLKGEEIPISAQVVSLVDVYDALTSKRVYKEAYSHEKAMKRFFMVNAAVLIRCYWNVYMISKISYKKN